jgi:hypothetical protein
VNDNAPRFERANYAVELPEDVPVGTSFFRVHADDPDDGPNGQLDYHIVVLRHRPDDPEEQHPDRRQQLEEEEEVSNDDNNPFESGDEIIPFRLDRTSGTLRVNAPLDRETRAEWVFAMTI